MAVTLTSHKWIAKYKQASINIVLQLSVFCILPYCVLLLVADSTRQRKPPFLALLQQAGTSKSSGTTTSSNSGCFSSSIASSTFLARVELGFFLFRLCTHYLWPGGRPNLLLLLYTFKVIPPYGTCSVSPTNLVTGAVLTVFYNS